MKLFNRRSFAAFCAAVLAGAALAGCSSSGSSDSGSDSAASEKSGGDKKLEVYIDDNGTPYFYDNEGNKMMLWASEYDISLQGESMDDQEPAEYVYGNYDKGGIAFTIPDGWLVDDMGGAPTLLKGTGDSDIDVDHTISILPVQMMFGFEIDPNVTVDEKFLKEYYNQMVELGIYDDFKILKTGEGKIGSEQAKVFEISENYTETDEEGKQTKVEARSVIYATTGDNVSLVVMNSTGGDDEMKALVKVYDSIKDTIKLPNADQVKKMVDDYSGAFEEVDEDDFGSEDEAELTGDNSPAE